jgi:hypothetical protein
MRLHNVVLNVLVIVLLAATIIGFSDEVVLDAFSHPEMSVPTITLSVSPLAI